ncbi:hypothetical protein HF319_11445 [Xanthomonas sp. Kuri4-1]
MTLALSGALSACGGSGSEPVAPRPESEHFNLADLQQLGCTVAVAPKRNLSRIPLMGEVDGYGMSSTTPCATQLASLLQSAKYEDAVWVGVRTAAGNFAEKHGLARESQPGRLGEHSEIEIFSRDGTPVGFEYSVQARGRLHSVILMSDRLRPDAAFEALLQQKL